MESIMDNEEKKFTQAELDSLLATHKRSLQQRVTEQDAKIADLVAKMPAGLEKEKLETELEQTRLAALSEQERRIQEAKKFDEALTSEKGEKNKWAGRFKATLLEQTLTGAAAQAGAWRPQQVVNHLKTYTRVEQAKDGNGRYIDAFRVVCRLPDTNVDCTPKEAIDALRQTDANYFRENVAKDIGRGIVSGSDGRLDVRSLTTEEHIRLRATPEGRRALGLRVDPRR